MLALGKYKSALLEKMKNLVARRVRIQQKKSRWKRKRENQNREFDLFFYELVKLD